jgi:hypothetical protein
VILGFFKILIVLNGDTNIEGELGGNNIVNGIGKGDQAVENDDFIIFERGAGVVDQDNLQDAIVNGVTFSKGYIYFKMVGMNVVINKGGNDEVASGGVRDRDLVEGGGKQIV